MPPKAKMPHSPRKEFGQRRPREDQLEEDTDVDYQERYQAVRSAMMLRGRSADIGDKTYSDVWSMHSTQKGVGVLDVFRRKSMPYEEPLDANRAAQELAKLVLEKSFVEVQCAVTRSKTAEKAEPRYILSSNKNRGALMNRLDRVLANLKKIPEGNRRQREKEIISAIENKRITSIDEDLAKKLSTSSANTAPDHAETLYLHADEELRQAKVLAHDHEVVKVRGNRRPCTDCAQAYIAAGKGALIESDSVVQPIEQESRQAARDARGEVKYTFEHAKASVHLGRQYGSEPSRAGYDSVISRGKINPKVAMQRIALAIKQGKIDPSRYAGEKPGDPFSTPLVTPAGSRAGSEEPFDFE